MEVKQNISEDAENGFSEENILKRSKAERIAFIEAELETLKESFELMNISHKDILRKLASDSRQRNENKLFEIGVLILLGFFSASLFFILIYGAVLC